MGHRGYVLVEHLKVKSKPKRMLISPEDVNRIDVYYVHWLSPYDIIPHLIKLVDKEIEYTEFLKRLKARFEYTISKEEINKLRKANVITILDDLERLLTMTLIGKDDLMKMKLVAPTVFAEFGLIIRLNKKKEVVEVSYFEPMVKNIIYLYDESYYIEPFTSMYHYLEVSDPKLIATYHKMLASLIENGIVGMDVWIELRGRVVITINLRNYSEIPHEMEIPNEVIEAIKGLGDKVEIEFIEVEP